MEDPLVAGVALTLLQGRMDLAADLPLAVAGWGMERLQRSLEYCGVTLALAGQSLACRSMLEYGLCWLQVQWMESWRSCVAEARLGFAGGSG